MFTVSVQTSFRASHQLALSDGSKESEHSHNWVVTAGVSSDILNNIGMVMDFDQLKSAVEKIVSEFNNISLDRIDYFKQNNPSAENVAKYIFNKLEQILPRGLKLRNIKVEEELGCSAEFSKI
jgi:6-pyruvoyltetrahydropterin/6-carboxytetrahydropterin synthase